jgi:hypothetical protein
MEDHNLAALLGGRKILINHGTGHRSVAKPFELLCDEYAVGFLDAPSVVAELERRPEFRPR